MTVEAFHGRCQACGHGPILARWGSMGWTWFEVCPACGFALSTGQGTWPEEGPELAETVLYHGAEHLEERGIDPRLYWYAKSLVEERVFHPEAPSSRLIECLELEEALKRHHARGKRVLTPEDVVGHAGLMAYLDAHEPQTAEALRRLFPSDRKGR